ncbi:MAG: 2-phosphosulfolactate phosphatase [Planctomycetes bacterium]|nr:2-phosphosulfolactate phosphatase [Planctomycetota bacterium]
MQINVTLYPTELKKTDQKGKTVVIIDVLRGSSTMVYALAHGCKEIYPMPDIKTARRKWKACKNDQVLLGGEQNGFKVKGFDLGNSPEEYTSEKICGKTLIFTTTNCTKTLRFCKNPHEVLICAFLNAGSVAQYLCSAKRDIVFALSGNNDTYSMEDMMCAGLVIDKISKYRKVNLSDTALSARIIYNKYRGCIRKGLLDSFHGKHLEKVGMRKDVIFCARIGQFAIIPKYSNGVISI